MEFSLPDGIMLCNQLRQIQNIGVKGKEMQEINCRCAVNTLDLLRINIDTAVRMT